MAFECTVVTPEQQAFSAPITQAILPAHDGLVGVLTGRAPMLVKLGTGALRLDLPDGKKTWLVVDGGVAQMQKDRLTIVTERAIAPRDIDVAAVQAEYEQVANRQPATPAEVARRQHDLALVRAKQEVAAHR